MDWPTFAPQKPVVSIISGESVGLPTSVLGGATPASAVWPSANLAIFVPFALRVPYLVKTLWWANGAAVAGNVDCGIYTDGGALLTSAGSTAQAGTNVIQSVALATPVLLEPMSGYIALSASSTSAAFFRYATNARQGPLMGFAQQASAVPLPASFTLASYSNAYVPLFGFARATVI